MKPKLFPKSSILLIALFFIVIAQTNTVKAQETNATEAPFFVVNCTDTSHVSFPLLSTNIDATISGVIASVEIEQVYFNSGDSVINATYVFPMSTNAAVYAMEMEVQGRLIEAEIKEKLEAQAIFDSAQAHGHTASLLEQYKSNVFQMSLANIKPNDTVSVRMKYTELVEPEKGIYEFVLPSIVGPRFTLNNEEWVNQTHEDSLAVSQTELNIELTVNAGMDLSINSLSHNVTFDIDGGYAHCYLETHPEKDFIVDFSLDGREIETGLLLYEGEDENFFLAMIQPPKPEVNFASPKREYVFIMDVSGSMSGTPLSISKDLILNLLEGLKVDDKFNILFFAGGSAVLSPFSLPATLENINKASEMIDNMIAGGGTMLLPALQQALNMEGTANYSRTFVILTDGYVTVEKQAYELIRENLNKANFFSFGIGRSVNREIIEGMAYVGQGESFVVTENEYAAGTADLFKEYIESPVLTNISTAFSNINLYDIEPISIPDVFAERPILIYGKYDDATNGEISISGDYADGTISKTLNFNESLANANDNIALMYLWARRRIKLMSDYGIASNTNDTLTIDEEVTQLGLKYNLVTEFTSFVAVDSLATSDPGQTSDDPEYIDGFFGATSGIEIACVMSTSQPSNLIKSAFVMQKILKVTLDENWIYNTDDLKLVIVNISGQVIFEKQLYAVDLVDHIQLDISDLATGLYFVQLKQNEEVIGFDKFVK